MEQNNGCTCDPKQYELSKRNTEFALSTIVALALVHISVVNLEHSSKKTLDHILGDKARTMCSCITCVEHRRVEVDVALIVLVSNSGACNVDDIRDGSTFNKISL